MNPLYHTMKERLGFWDAFMANEAYRRTFRCREYARRATPMYRRQWLRMALRNWREFKYYARKARNA